MAGSRYGLGESYPLKNPDDFQMKMQTKSTYFWYVKIDRQNKKK